MRQVYAAPGEVVYDLLLRAKEEAINYREIAVEAYHNGTAVIVYRDSYIKDLCDKWAMARAAQQLLG